MSDQGTVVILLLDTEPREKKKLTSSDLEKEKEVRKGSVEVLSVQDSEDSHLLSEDKK